MISNRQAVIKATLTILALSAVLVSVGSVTRPNTPPVDLSPYPWLYLREGKALHKDEQLIEMIAVGDVFLGRAVAGESEPFDLVSPWLQAADVTFGNFEGVIDRNWSMKVSNQEVEPGHPITLSVPANSVSLLHSAGFDLLGLANNHAYDRGQEGIETTISLLQADGMHAWGALKDLAIASQQKNGLRLAFLAVNMVPSPLQGKSQVWSSPEIIEAIQTVGSTGDVVIVSLHWGYEYQVHPTPMQRDLAQAMIEAGADLVVGHHPHVVQGTQIFSQSDQDSDGKIGFVAYSLGNFVFDQFEGESLRGLALRGFFDQGGLRAIQALPVWAGTKPRLMSLPEVASILQRVVPAALRLNYGCDKDGCYSIPSTEGNLSGRFGSGEIDLTGDGILENVSLHENRLTIFAAGVQVWQSPIEWQVLDLALGDPNDDGRRELILVVKKEDDDGVLRSHPFIVGYRGGIYRLIWGGSAVSEPIQEVDLGDVNGDGIQELVVIAEQDKGNAVSIWRWHGWGFSQLWRSPVGWYHDLMVIPDAKRQIIAVLTEW